MSCSYTIWPHIMTSIKHGNVKYAIEVVRNICGDNNKNFSIERIVIMTIQLNNLKIFKIFVMNMSCHFNYAVPMTCPYGFFSMHKSKATK